MTLVFKHGPREVQASYNEDGSFNVLTDSEGKAITFQGTEAASNTLNSSAGFVSIGVNTTAPNVTDGILRDSDGTPVAAMKANVIPRTDTEAILLNTQGNAGEIASATDTNAIVKFNGALGGAVKFSPFGGSTRDNGALATIKPDADRITTTGGAARTISAGVFVGQTIAIVPASAFVLTGVATLQAAMEYTLRWSGTVWQLIYGQPIKATQVNGTTLIGSVTATGANSVVIGPCTVNVAASTGASAVSIGTGRVTGASGVNIGFGAANGTSSVALNANANCRNEVALMAANGKHEIHSLQVKTANATPAVLTASGTTPVDATNCVSLQVGQSGINCYRAVILVAEVGTNNCAKLVRNVLATTWYDEIGTGLDTYVVNAVTTEAGADVFSGIAGVSVAVTVNATGVLLFTVTGLAGRNLEWAAHIIGGSAYVTNAA